MDAGTLLLKIKAFRTGLVFHCLSPSRINAAIAKQAPRASIIDNAVIFPSFTTSIIAPKQLHRQVAANSGLIAASIAAPACRCLVLVFSFPLRFRAAIRMLRQPSLGKVGVELLVECFQLANLEGGRSFTCAFATPSSR